ncbi:MAG: hypothetical protein KAI79_11500, partial [Bacteroidales bacterium]|nr:hypothetical protein [Bacteroidales bacterium]
YQTIFNTVTDTSVMINYTKGTPNRILEGARVELDLFHHLKFGVNAFRSYDNQNSIVFPYNELENKYTFLGNIVAGTDATLHFNHDRTLLHAEYALSAVNDVLVGDSMLVNDAGLSSSMLSDIADMLQFPLTDDLVLGSAEGRGLSITFPDTNITKHQDMDAIMDYALNDVLKKGTYRLEFKTPLNLYFTKLDLNAEYKRVPANFVSLGNASIQTDIQALKTTARARFFKNKISLSGGYESKFDNVAGNTKPQTTNTLTKVGGLGLNIPYLPTVNYSLRIMDRTGEPASEDTIGTSNNIILNDNQTMTHTLTPSLRFTIFNTSFNFSGNLMLMNYEDKSLNEINSNFVTQSYLGTTNINFPFNLGVSFGAGQSQTNPDQEYQSSTIFDIYSGKMSLKYLNKKMNSYVGFNLVKGFKDANGTYDSGEELYVFTSENPIMGIDYIDKVEIENQKVTLKLGTQYKLNRQTSLGLTVDHVTVKDSLKPEKDYSELRVKLKLKIMF